MGGAAPHPLLAFRIAGIQVEVRPFFLVVAIAGALQWHDARLGAIWFAVATVSVLWHEMGHALAMKQFGYPPAIELHALGGLARWPPGAAPTAREALVVTAAGPGAGLVLGSVLWALVRVGPPLSYPFDVAMRTAIFVNIAWSLFNLLPILPLDGGNLLDHVARLAKGTTRPRWVGWVSAVTGAGVALYGFSRQSTFLGILGLVGAANGISRVRAAGGLAWLGSASEVPAPERARRALSRGDKAGAVAALFPAARLGQLDEPSIGQLVDLLVQLGRTDALVELVRERLTAFARRDDAEPLARLAAEALAAARADGEALEVAQVAFQQLRIAYHAYDAAVLLVRFERHAEAVRWLARAVDAGLDCSESLLTDPDLDPLRQRSDFRDLLAKAGAATA